jgi:hypothetical protein
LCWCDDVILQALSWLSRQSPPSLLSCLHTCGVHPTRRRPSTKALKDC